ncbi:MAG: hypothetical protein JWN90_56 [Parcubacteria group bacterium]|nr:hypothetical protein [Parcubacteria group bacterium]
MGTLGKIVIGILVLSALVVFFRSYYPGSSPAAVVLAPTIKLATSTASVAADALPNADTYVELQGTALMDTTSGLPAVPFIQYIASDHSLVTKQLIFANSRGCSPNAGDIPCVPSYGTDNAYPDLTTGQHILVKGYIRADRLLVYEITTL